jgi:uncharacterized protein YaiI (UPF0178 family)
MQIFVDADACPVKEIIVRVAKENNLPVTMIIDSSHELCDNYSTIITVEKAKDNVDLVLINQVKSGDIVVTQDYGLAALVLGKSAKALNQNGLVFSNDNIDRLLMERHIGQKIRRGGGRTKGPGKRTCEDDERFAKAFREIVKRFD